MNTTENTTAAAVSAPVAKVKKQHTLTANEETKTKIMELAREFHGFAVSDPSKPKYLTSEEILDVLYTVATDRRFKTDYVFDENGDYVLDEDGAPELTTVDLIEVEAMKIINARTARTTSSTVATLQAKLAEAQRALAALGWDGKGGVLPTTAKA